MIVGVAVGFAKLQVRLDETAKKVDVLYQRALWDQRDTHGPQFPLNEE